MSLKFEEFIHVDGDIRAWVYGIDDNNHTYKFAVTAEALEEHFGMEKGTANMSATVQEYRIIIEDMWRDKFSAGEFRGGDTILLTMEDHPPSLGE